LHSQKEIYMTTTVSLQLALAANALFSISCAALMLLRPSLVSSWLGVQFPLILQAIGIGLLFFAVDLLHQATRRRIVTWRALYASAADFLWVIGTFTLLGLFPNVLSHSGNRLVISVAVTVLIFGVWQVWAIEKAHKLQNTGEYRHCILVETNAPAEAMWRVVSRLGGIKDYMPSLKSSVVLDGRTPGIGAVRMCEDRTGKQWSEQCTEFNVRSFTVRFLSEAPDFPFPAKTMHGGWEVIPTDRGSQVMVWWELLPKKRLLAPLILPLLAFQADRNFPKVIQRMAAAALGHTSEAANQPSPRAIARLLPNFC
jgi:Polyketide cyclase / dehydrase and lipid transport